MESGTRVQKLKSVLQITKETVAVVRNPDFQNFSINDSSLTAAVL